MNKEKQVYLSPETETLVIRFEEIICQSTGDTSITDWGDGNDFPIVF